MRRSKPKIKSGKSRSERLERLSGGGGQTCGESHKASKARPTLPQGDGFSFVQTGYFGNNDWVNLRHGGSESGRQGGPR